MKKLNKRVVCTLIILSILFTNSIALAEQLNKKEFDYCNITKWHKEYGYTGKGVKIIVDDLMDEYYHGNKVYEVVKQVAPDANIILVGHIRIKHLLDLALKEKAQIVTRSLYTPSWNTFDYSEHFKLAYDSGIFLNGSAGNYAGEKYNPHIDSPYWFSTGAVQFKSNTVKRTSYSSYADGLNVMGFGELKVKVFNTYYDFGGTSAATPFVSGMIALYYEYFKDTNGRFPTVEEARQFIIDNTKDLESKGYDIYTGHGLFILPNLDEKDGD